MDTNRLESLKGRLIVSCQALPEEPLHSSFIMGRMALAAERGGAAGIRANSVQDILEIKKNTKLPIIGIIKKDYSDSPVYITPTMTEVDDLVRVQPEIIALDATASPRPGGTSLESFYQSIREKYPGQYLMADCSTIEEALFADELGFDFIGTTLVGYTKQSKEQHLHIEENDFFIIRELKKNLRHALIAEGNIDTPKKLRRVMELGVFSAVVGSAITRPQIITRRFVETLPGLSRLDEGKR